MWADTLYKKRQGFEKEYSLLVCLKGTFPSWGQTTGLDSSKHIIKQLSYSYTDVACLEGTVAR